MINKKFAYKLTEGLPGGPNELKKFIKGSISITGYKSDSPDLYNDFNIIPSNRITMQDVDFPVLGIDNLGNEQMMMPGGEYQFPGDYVTELPQMGKGGLTQWFAEEWTDVKTGKKCGRSGKEKGSRPYPACRPKKKVNETTPKTISEMSSAEKAKFKREKTSGKRIDYNHKRKEFGGETGWLDEYQDGGVPKRMGVRTNPDGTVSTHLMRAETLDGENWIAFPSLFQNADSSWVDMSQEEDWYPVYEEAKRRGEVIDFGKDKQKALDFGAGSWKKLYNKQSGGHVIQPGQTFYGIANKYGVPKESFIAANPDLNINRIRAGQRIRVPEEYSSVEHEEYPTGYFSVGDEKVFEGISKFPKEDKPKPKKETKTSAGLTNDILLRQAFAESTFNPKAKSPAGYMGLGQIGDAVIKDYKKATGVKKVDPYNPAQNAAVQKWAMNQIYNADFINKEDQDPNVRLAKTLASYNWGKGNVKKYLTKQKAKGVDIYNSLDWVEGLPKETRDYIHKIQLSDMPEFEKGFNKAVKDKKYLPYINLYKKKYGGWLDTYSTKTNWLENYN